MPGADFPDLPRPRRPDHPGKSASGAARPAWRRPGISAVFRAEEDAAIERARTLLLQVDLWRLADHAASSLSGGQKKLLEVLRAMMLSPKVILLDEPAARVAPTMEGVLCDFNLSLKEEGVTFAIVEHDMEMIEALCDSIYVMI
ncbi:ATP-binding cassette domain-containing protein [Leisingera sp. ANG-M1]|uniref:ATP-binding cassette domain-containing protein n=1 Tax=Leisingera sp. ANG-M1 TaxID=1577895 RepID=UPI00068D19C3|nr:ATP-binding cassette domain-containing protein [Leisingera sp. ANG-M1]